MTATRLYTFWISHFSEKVRWALRYEGIEFEHKALLPGPHVATLRRIAPGRQVPVLVHQGVVIQGSGAILDAIPDRFGKSRLQPWTQEGQGGQELSRRARELESLADQAFGEAIQTYGYSFLLKDRKAVIDSWSFRGAWWAPVFYKLAFPSIERALLRAYCRSPAHVDRARERLLAAFDETDAILSNQPYLLSEGPSRVDIAVSALLCPLVRPPEHELPWPEYPEPLENFCQGLKERPTFRFVERMYKQHRPVPSNE